MGKGKNTTTITVEEAQANLSQLIDGLALYTRDRGCTKPGCTIPAYGTQVHHTKGWARNHGQTNIDDLTLACPKDNREVKPGGWRTRKRKDGRTEWIPPPHLDRRQSRGQRLSPPGELPDTRTDGQRGERRHRAATR